MTLLDIKKSITKLIVNNKTVSALEKLSLELDGISDTDYSYQSNQIVLMQARYKKALDQYQRGTLSIQAFNIEQNKINEALLNLLDDLDKNKVPSVLKKEKKQSKYHWLILGLIVVLASGALAYWKTGINKNKPTDQTEVEKLKNNNPESGAASVDNLNKESIPPSAKAKTAVQPTTPTTKQTKSKDKESLPAPTVQNYFSITTPLDIGIIAYTGGKVNSILSQSLSKYYKENGFSVSTSITSVNFHQDNYFNLLLQDPALAIKDPNGQKMKVMVLADQMINGNSVDIKLIQFNTKTGMAKDFSTQITLPSTIIPGKEQEMIRKKLLDYLRRTKIHTEI